MPTSEQALTALEHSLKPTVDLLDDAAATIGFSLQQRVNGTDLQRTTSPNLDKSRFREQWILRWIIKRLNQALDTSQKSDEHRATLLLDIRTWNLLEHLLASIPRHFSKSILLERNFCQVFGACLDTIASLDEKRFVAADTKSQNEGRPSKKRKISPELSIPVNVQSPGRTSLSMSLLRVADQTAQSISTSDEDNISRHNRTPSNWASSIDEAALFLGRLVALATTLRTSRPQVIHEIDQDLVKPTVVINRWTDLWEAAATVANNQRKQDPSAAFVNHALISALDFLGRTSENVTKASSQALERQVAITCVLPMRSVFQKQFSTKWNSWDSESHPDTVQKAVKTLVSKLGHAASGLHDHDGELRAATLLRIASRIIPSSDVVKKRAERSWIEALFLCLCSLLEDRGVTQAKLNDGEFHITPSIPLAASSVCLSALQATGIQPSISFWRNYIQSIFINEQKYSIEILAEIVRLNAAAFVEEQKESTMELLSGLCSNLEHSLTLDNLSIQIGLRDVIVPVWEEFGKKKRLDLLNDFWIVRLSDTFHERSIVDIESTSNILWDHPDLLKQYSSICQQHASPSFRTDVFQNAVDYIARLPDIVGPAHDVFARVTILIAMLGSVRKISAGQPTDKDMYQKAGDLSVTALLRSTDYQGHRWRLWKLLEQLVQQTVEPLRLNGLRRLKLPWLKLELDALYDCGKKSPPKSLYMDLLQSFCCILSFCEAQEADAEPLLQVAMEKLDACIDQFCKSDTHGQHPRSTWDGLVSTLDNPLKLMSACIARLARSSLSWSTLSITPKSFTMNLAHLTYRQRDANTHCDLATAAEAALTSMMIVEKTNLTDMYTKSPYVETIQHGVPSILHTILGESTDEKQKTKLFDEISAALANTDPNSQRMNLQHIGLVSEALLTETTISGSIMKAYIDLLHRNTVGASTDEAAAAYQFIRQVTKSLFAQSGVSSADEKSSAFKDLLTWTKEQYQEIDIADDFVILGRYTGYILLAVVHEITRIDPTKLSEKSVKVINKIKKYHPSAVLKQCDIYLQESRGKVNFWFVLVLLETLEASQDDEFDKKLQKCLQKVVRIILLDNAERSQNATSCIDTRVIAKLWYVLRKHTAISKSGALPDFPHASFAQGTSQGETSDSLALRAQLATRYPLQKSLVDLARLANLSTSEMAPKESESDSAAPYDSLLAVASKVKKLVLDDVSTDIETIKVLGDTARLQTAIEETSPAALIARLELSKMVFEKHSAIVNQHVIDSTLTSVMILASSASKIVISTDSNGVKPEHIFNRLCTILSTLLVRYRRRLAGRHHLLLPALQNLLRCLFFTPSTQRTKSPTYLATLPSWLTSSQDTHAIPLSPSSATKFSRILQHLSDPSTSTARNVSKNANSNNLTDDVKSLRREVSKHTQYLLQTHCQVMLEGYIAPEVREKLLPGLYAVMNAMEVEAMRGLNAAMDGSQRAVWRDLYEEWRSFGKWNQR